MLCTLLLGTNLGNKRNNLSVCIKYIEEKVGKIIQQSSVYETEPWGFKSKELFYNMAIEVETKLNPQELLKTIKEFEIEMGRKHTSNYCYENRIIDLDILFYNNKVINLSELTIPHPKLHLRKFTLVPLIELLQNIEHPVFKKNITTLLNDYNDTSTVANIGCL